MKKGKLVKCKPKFNPFTKQLVMNTGGFPDFIAIKRLDEKYFDVVGVEVKLNGILSKEEKEKCKFLLEKGIFNEIWIAVKEKDLKSRKIVIKYQNFKERYKDF